MDHETKVDLNKSFVLEVSPDQTAISVFNIQSQSYLQKIIKTLNDSINHEGDDAKKVVSYVWSHEAKDIAILLRDCMLNLLKLRYFEKEKLKSKEEAIVYRVNISKTLRSASTDLSNSYANIVDGKIKPNNNWVHEINPAALIIDQLKTIIDQIKKIDRSQHKLDNIEVSFEAFKKSYHENMQVRIQRSNDLKDILNNLDNSIKEIPELTNSDALKKQIDVLDKQVAELENQSDLSDYEFIVLDDIDKLNIPVATDAGNLQYKQIDILSEVSSWTTFNMSSPLRDIDRRLLNFKERVSVTLMQMSNRLKAKNDINEDAEFAFEANEMCKPLHKLLNDHEAIIVPEVHESIEGLKDKLDKLINVSKMFDEHNLFLPVSRISQLSSGLTFKDTLHKRYNLDKIVAGFHQITKGIFTDEKIKERPTAATYIDSILDFDIGSDQTALFMRKGFLGSSFHIERSLKENAMKRHFKLWKSDFGGSLLITGGHLSGKSSLLELITIQNPEAKNYNIIINHSIDINGHKIMVGKDLVKSLKEIVKYLGDTPSIITIDNLGQYVSHAIDMYDFFNALQNVIIKYSQKIYFAVVIEERQYERLKSYFNLDNIFSEIVNANDMSPAQIEDALQVRALAVADHDEVAFNSDKLRQRARRIANKSHGNVGLAMQLWCTSFALSSKSIPDLGFNEKMISHKSILTYLMSFDEVKMSKLKMFFDDYEFKKIKADLEHLCQQKILVRKSEGNIQVQPFLRPLIDHVLSQNKFD